MFAEGQKVYRRVTAHGVVVESSAPFPAHWWDRHIAFGVVGSYMLWSANIAADVGWVAPKRWMKRIDAAMNRRFC